MDNMVWEALPVWGVDLKGCSVWGWDSVEEDPSILDRIDITGIFMMPGRVHYAITTPDEYGHKDIIVYGVPRVTESVLLGLWFAGVIEKYTLADKPLIGELI